MQILNEQDIINVMNGAALLAAGGGGCFDDGMILLESFKKNHPDKPITVRLVDVSEMEDGACAAVVAGMGAPTEGAGKDFTPCAVDAFAEVQRMAAEMGKGGALYDACGNGRVQHLCANADLADDGAANAGCRRSRSRCAGAGYAAVAHQRRRHEPAGDGR